MSLLAVTVRISSGRERRGLATGLNGVEMAAAQSRWDLDVRVYYSDLPAMAFAGGVAYFRPPVLRIFLYADLPYSAQVDLIEELVKPEERLAALRALNAAAVAV